MSTMLFATLWDRSSETDPAFTYSHEPVAFNTDNISHMAVSGNSPYATRIFFRTPVMPWGAYVNVLEDLQTLSNQILSRAELWEPRTNG